MRVVLPGFEQSNAERNLGTLIPNSNHLVHSRTKVNKTDHPSGWVGARRISDKETLRHEKYFSGLELHVPELG